MKPFEVHEHKLFWSSFGETLCIQAWGKDAVRVRATMNPEFVSLPGALLAEPEGATPEISMDAKQAMLVNGKLRVVLSSSGRLSFYHHLTGALLLQEPFKEFYNPPMRDYRARSSDLFHLEVRFEAQEGERFYGLGQHQHGRLNQKGCVIELEQRNTEVCIPFLLSSRGYGFLWHNPAIGRVELGENQTRWVAEATRQLDYVVWAGDTPAEILTQYTQAVGRAPLLPEWALGFWQCKLRYRTQEELLNVAREYQRRGLPLSVIVVDYFHWPMMGEWKFDPEFWPDPAGMIKELKQMGVELMVSIWGTVNPNSSNYAHMAERGLLVRAERGNPALLNISDRFPPGQVMQTYYDPTNPEARRFIWSQVRQNYVDLGIRVLWLDADEPEIYPMHHENLRYLAGNGLEVSSIYPLLHQQAFYEGMQEIGEKEFVFLSRSAWAGSQRYGAAVWSGDIPSTFEALQIQVRAGLNIAMSGIPWWTTDIGGFRDGNIHDPYFQELIVRWFQYGVFCPLFRLHGVRLPMNHESGAMASGADNEVWAFGDQAYAIIKDLLFLRERMKPYLMALNRQAHQNGTPPMRPVWFDFPTDPVALSIDDQFMLGADVLVAPVLHRGVVQRRVYLPAGTSWKNAWSGEVFQGGQWLEVQAPLDSVPVFWRAAARPW